MKCKELIRILEEQSPVSSACEWDNVGLLAGDLEQEIGRVYIALDASEEAVDEAVSGEADFLLTHHPLIFRGIKRVNADDFIGRRVRKLIANNISYYAMHTNFDVSCMADLSAAMLGLEDCQVLDVTDASGEGEQGIGRAGNLMRPMTLEECARLVKAAFSVKGIRIFGDPGRVLTRVAICPGSGKGEIANALAREAQVLITGDIGHHEGIDAVAQGLSIIDAGHYGLEHIFVDYMENYLKARCEGVEIVAQKLTFPYFTM